MNDLLDISERLRTQDNRCTAEPMFCLQIKMRDVGYAPDYAGETVWINMESGDYNEVAPNSPGAEEFGYKDRWETVMVAFTEQGIADYMDKDGHNVKRRAYRGETRVYVESFNRCDEMVRIRHALMSNATGQGRRQPYPAPDCSAPDYWGPDGRCHHCGAGNDAHHSYACPTNMHHDKREPNCR